MAVAKLNAQNKQERDAIIQRMIDMKNEGKTYQVIADEFGISKQRVQQLIGNRDARYFRYIKKTTCIYKGIRKYLNDNKISVAEFVRRTHGCYHPVYMSRLMSKLRGETDMQKRYIDKILEVTGLTYEVAFELEEDV
jgi:hypothetical protein